MNTPPDFLIRKNIMHAYFLRHGETDFNKDRRISGHADVPLNDEGIQQAKEVIIPDECMYIVSSDLLRCRQTMEQVNTKYLPVRYDARLREKGYGTLEGRYWADVDPDETIWQTLRKNTYDFRAFGGESAENVKERLLEALYDLHDEALERGTPLVITSSGVIRFLHTLLAEPRDIIENVSVHAFELPKRSVV